MLHDLLVDHIRDPHASWACGRFGAIAEFHRDPDEPAEIATEPLIEAATSRGAIRIEVRPDLRRSPTRRSARASKAGGRAWCSACRVTRRR